MLPTIAANMDPTAMRVARLLPAFLILRVQQRQRGPALGAGRVDPDFHDLSRTFDRSVPWGRSAPPGRVR